LTLIEEHPSANSMTETIIKIIELFIGFLLSNELMS